MLTKHTDERWYSANTQFNRLVLAPKARSLGEALESTVRYFLESELAQHTKVEIWECFGSSKSHSAQLLLVAECVGDKVEIRRV